MPRPVRKRKIPEQEDLYEVEAIMAHRIKENSTEFEYLVKWRGYHVSESTWEPLANNQCPDMIKDYFRILSYQEARRSDCDTNPSATTNNNADVATAIREASKPTEELFTSDDHGDKPTADTTPVKNVASPATISSKKTQSTAISPSKEA